MFHLIRRAGTNQITLTKLFPFFLDKNKSSINSYHLKPLIIKTIKQRKKSQNTQYLHMITLIELYSKIWYFSIINFYLRIKLSALNLIFSLNKQARISSWSCGAIRLLGENTKRGTDIRQTDKQTHRGVYRVAPQLKTTAEYILENAGKLIVNKLI